MQNSAVFSFISRFSVRKELYFHKIPCRFMEFTGNLHLLSKNNTGFQVISLLPKRYCYAPLADKELVTILRYTITCFV